MKILVLGTSNSLTRDGWIGGLRDALPSASIDNRSVGASSGIQFSLNMDTDFSEYDVVIFDSIPNDEQHLREDFGPNGYSSEDFVNQIIFEIASTISSETALIFLGFCSESSIDSISSTYKTRIQISQAVHAQFLDLRQLMLQFSLNILGPGEHLFRDPPHPQTIVSRTIGLAVGDVLSGLSEKDSGLVIKKSLTAKSYRKNFSLWIADIDAGARSLHRFKNSIFDENYVILSENDEIDLHIPGKCIGFNINSFATSCNVELIGAHGIKSIISCFFTYRDGGFQKIFLAIPHGAPLTKVAIRAEQDNVDFRAYGSQWKPQHTPVQLCVSRFAFWTGDVTSDWKHHHDGDFDAWALTKLVERRLQAITSFPPMKAFTPSRIIETLNRMSSIVRFAAGLFSYHGTVLAYDCTSDRVRSVDIALFEASQELLPIRLRLRGSDAELYVVLGSLELTLVLRLSDFSIGFEREINFSLAQSTFLFRSKDTDVYTLECCGYYLCAEPSGIVICNRKQIGAWEFFKIIRT